MESESDCVHRKYNYTSKGRVSGGQQLESWTQSLFVVPYVYTLDVCLNVPPLGPLHMPQLLHQHMLHFSHLRDAGPVGALWAFILDYLGRIPQSMASKDTAS